MSQRGWVWLGCIAFCATVWYWVIVVCWVQPQVVLRTYKYGTHDFEEIVPSDD